MSNGGEELNPLMNYLMGAFGVLSTLIITKTLFVALLIYAAAKALNKKNLTKREFYAVISSYSFIIMFYSYFMYFHNFQHLMIL